MEFEDVILSSYVGTVKCLLFQRIYGHPV
jgi:hypothetical protein